MAAILIPESSEAAALRGKARPAIEKPAVALKKLRLFNIGTIPVIFCPNTQETYQRSRRGLCDG
jgi:hypothetical protein